MASPVEAYALYDGQLVPARDGQLLLAGFCPRDKMQIKFRAATLGTVFFLMSICSTVTFITVITPQHDGQATAVSLCLGLKHCSQTLVTDD